MKVVEVFASIQGEGRFIGEPTCFVRLAGCNMRCSWCDTKKSWIGGEEKSVQEVAAEAESYGMSPVCLTGGEPMLQKEELIELIKKLRRKNHKLVLETNGSLYDRRVFEAVDHVACDMKPPSSGERSDESILGRLRPADYVKVVVAGDEDLFYAKKIASLSPVEVFLQPDEPAKLNWLAGKVLEEGLRVRVLPQLHKMAGVK